MSNVPLWDPRDIFERLLEAYGPQHWWPGDTPFEITVGAVLTQNTAWHNVSIAIGNLKAAGLLCLDTLVDAPGEQISRLIRPAGFYRVKTVRLQNLLHVLKEYGGLDGLQSLSTDDIRGILISVNGVGPETADCILLYALNRAVFVVDGYTRRLLIRLGHRWAQTATYDDVQRWFAVALKPDTSLYGEYHALIVQHGKVRCRVRPLCQGCPLKPACTWEPAATMPPEPGVQPPARDSV